MKKYQNFEVAIYCPVGNLLDIKNLDGLAEQFSIIEKQIRVNKVYLETYRGGQKITRSQMEKIKGFFQSKGIKTSGGITTDAVPDGEGGFYPRCYTNPESRKEMKEIVEFTASMFDEIILDDFYFTNCKCEFCIAAKGNQNWTQFRLKQMEEVSRDLIVGPAKKINPTVKMIIKYPNWYEDYQECGYNLEKEPEIFDYVYTGTETRNPQFTQQHLPKYLSYFNLRYLENASKGKNRGGWFDTFECTYNLTSYAEQAYLTLFAKAREVTLFCFGTLLQPDFSLCAPVAGQVFADMDRVLGKLGCPTGTACYLPFHSTGENYLHNYLGMLGIPVEPFPDYPEEAETLLLTESSGCDPDLISKIKNSLLKGTSVIVTSGLVQKLGDSFKEFANVTVTEKKARVNRYAYSENGGVSFGGCLESSEKITISQIKYPTNDVWELIAGFGKENSFPMLLKSKYGEGRLYVLAVPDDYGDFYSYPRRLLAVIRQIFRPEIMLDAPAKVALFTYDNGTFAFRSFQPYYDTCSITVNSGEVSLQELLTGRNYEGEKTESGTRFRFALSPGVNRIFSIRKN